MKVADVMTYRVISISPDCTVRHAAETMLNARISGLPVVDEQNRLVGMVAEGDLVRRAELGTTEHRSRIIEFLLSPGRLAEEFQHSHGRKVKEIMRTNVHTVDENAKLIDAVEMLEKYHIGRLPVMRNGTLVGMLARSDLMKGLISQAPSGKSADAADWAIRDQILHEFGKDRWAPISSLNVSVRRGVVSLSGTIFDERERGALLVEVENVPGVKKVVDRLAWVDPSTGIFIYQPEEAQEESKRAAPRTLQ